MNLTCKYHSHIMSAFSIHKGSTITILFLIYINNHKYKIVLINFKVIII